jgi:hypothetical protein
VKREPNPRVEQLALEGMRRIRPGDCWACGKHLDVPIQYMRIGPKGHRVYAAIVCSPACYAEIFS